MRFSSSRFFFLSRNVNNQSCVIFEEKLGWNWNKKIVRSNKTERIRIRKYLYGNISCSKEEFIYLSLVCANDINGNMVRDEKCIHHTHPLSRAEENTAWFTATVYPENIPFLPKINRRALRYLLFLLRKALGAHLKFVTLRAINLGPTIRLFKIYLSTV